MEAETVVLNLVRYHELHDIERSVKEDKIFVNYFGGWGQTWAVYTKDDLVKELTDKIVELKERITELQDPPKPEPKTVSIDAIKCMTVREFKRLRKEIKI